MAAKAAEGGDKTPESPRKPSLLEGPLFAWDYRLGKAVYMRCQESKFLRLFATIITESGDEAFWFLAPTVVAASQALFNWGTEETVGFCVEVLGDVMLSCVIEMLLKFVFQRRRPTYATQATFYILPGEWWSFPSGHSQRASYLVRVLLQRDALREAIFGVTLAQSSLFCCLLFAWAIGVAWSRVAKGRHFPLDVLAGLCTGFLIAEVYATVGIKAWSALKLFAGSLTFAHNAVVLQRPELRLEGFPAHAILQTQWWAMQPFGLGLSITWMQVLLLAAPIFALFSYLASKVGPAWHWVFLVSQ